MPEPCAHEQRRRRSDETPLSRIHRVIPALSSLTVGAASFALSFVALRDVAAETRAVPEHLAWLVPIVIDGGVMCASSVIWAAAESRRRRPLFPFVVVTILVTLSVVVNAAHAGPSTLAKVIAALPPLVLLATLELAVTARGAATKNPSGTGRGGTGSDDTRPDPTNTIEAVEPVGGRQQQTRARKTVKPTRIRATEPAPEKSTGS